MTRKIKPLRKPPCWDHSPRSEATSYDAIAKGMSRELRDTDVPDVYVIEREAHQLLKSQEPSIVTDDEIAGFPFVLCDSPSHAKELLAQLQNDGKRVALICR